MSNWKSGYSVLAICATVVLISIISAITVSITVGDTDPEVFLRFIAGPTVGNLISTLCVAYLTVVNRRVTKIGTSVETVKNQTNGTNAALIDQVNQLLTAKTIQEPAVIIHDTQYPDEDYYT
jgi:hypothetical protein